MTNDYKPDQGKPPVLDAVLIPYRRSILAIAAMKLDMAAKHKLMGAVNPYLEWMQLPDAKARLANAGARHALEPWEVNTKDGTHLHLVHAIVGLLMALELHLKEQEDNPLIGYVSCMEERAGHQCRMPKGHPGAHAWPDHLMVPAGADWREKPCMPDSRTIPEWKATPTLCGSELPATNPWGPMACTRDAGHKGAHRDVATGLSWDQGENL